MPRPTSTHDQREAVRALAVQIGVREAARQLGINEDRVRQWSKRFHWIQRPITIQPNLPETMQSDLVTSVTDVGNVLQNYGKTTKMSLAKTVDKAAAKFSDLEGDEIIAKSDRLVNVTNAASKIHSWEAAQASSALNLNVLSGGRAIVQVNANENSDNEK